VARCSTLWAQAGNFRRFAADPSVATTDPARTPPPRRPDTGWERRAATTTGPRPNPGQGGPLLPRPAQPRPPHPDSVAPMVCPECGLPLDPGHVCPPRLDAVSAAWLARYRTTARRLPHLDAEQLGARVEQHLTGVAA
jgi:hypothetical protein